MKTYKLAIIGFGNVGQGLTKIISDKNDFLIEKFGISLSIVAVCDLFKGSISNPDGLDPDVLLSDLEKYGDLKSTIAPFTGWNTTETIDNSGADILVELAFTDLQTGEPAVSHIRQALNNGMHVSMTNKGPVALHFPELRKIALRKNVQIGIEGTVMSGTPSISLGNEMLLAAGITKIQGILNGTTNYILGEMSSGSGYEYIYIYIYTHTLYIERCLWDAYGMSMGCLWDVYGMPMGCLWDYSTASTRDCMYMGTYGAACLHL